MAGPMKRNGESAMAQQHTERRARRGPGGWLKRVLRGMWRQERGSVLALAAISVVGGVSLMGLSVDVGKVMVERRDTQNGVDAAALAGAQRLLEGGNTTQVTTEGTSWLTKNGMIGTGFTSSVHFPPASGSYAGNSDCVEVESTHELSTLVTPIGSKNVKSRAVACQEHDWREFSVITLNKTACDSLYFQNNVHFYVEQGGVFVNSECATAAHFEGNNTLDTDENRVVGGYVVDGSIDLSPDFETAPHIDDPLGGLAAPSGAVTIRTCPTLGSAGGTVTLQPGKYNCAISPAAGSGKTWTVTFAPGDFEITGGIVGDSSRDRFVFQGGKVTLGGSGMLMSSSARLNSAETMFYLSGGCLSLNGTFDLNFTAPSSGTYKNIVFFQSRSNTCGVQINGNGAAGNAGTIYAPAAKITYSGNVDSDVQFISDSFYANGGGCGLTTFSGGRLADVREVKLKE